MMNNKLYEAFKSSESCKITTVNFIILFRSINILKCFGLLFVVYHGLHMFSGFEIITPFHLKTLICKELRYFMKCNLISGVLFTMSWACVLAQRSVPNSLSDSVLSVTKGSTQFALELLQVSQHCIKQILKVSCGRDCSWFCTNLCWTTSYSM
jgi:hypothetical protein